MIAWQRRVASKRVANDWPKGTRVVWTPRGGDESYTGVVESTRPPGRDQQCVRVRLDDAPFVPWCDPHELKLL